jgi:membrane-bound metal-dependent hydrolase YbcI (DUF457 family)
MPQAVLHILLPLVLLSLFKDYYDKTHKNKFSLKYVLIGGIAGILSDIDFIFLWITSFTNNPINYHGTITHSIFIPIILVFLFFVFKNKTNTIGKHKLKLSIIFLVIALGTFAHLILDMLFHNQSFIFYPISNINLGLNLQENLPYPLNLLLLPTIDAILLITWLIYLELKHKISDFI